MWLTTSEVKVLIFLTHLQRVLLVSVTLTASFGSIDNSGPGLTGDGVAAPGTVAIGSPPRGEVGAVT